MAKALKPVDPVRFDPVRFDPIISSEPFENDVPLDRGMKASAVLLNRLALEAKNGAAWYSHRAVRWGRVYLTLGLPAAVLAAIAGAAALASTTTRIVGGIIALTAAGVSAAAAFLDSRNSQKRFEDLAAAWRS